MRHFAIFTASFLTLWELTTRLLSVSALILPAPSDIASAIYGNFTALCQEMLITAFEAVSGFLIASVLGYLLAIVFVYSRFAKNALYPYAIALKATPLIAIAPLIIMWVGSGVASKIVMASVIAFFPVLVNSVKGLEAVDEEILDIANSLDATKLSVFKHIIFPHSLPYVFPALRIASTLAVVGALIGEFIGSNMGIGFLINKSSYYLETDLMFAAIFCASLFGIIFFLLIGYIEKKVVFWEDRLWD